MKKVIIVTLKVLAVLFLVFGIVASIGLSTMSMRGMMRYFSEPYFNMTAFVSTLFLTLLTSASLYGFAVLIEIQDESLEMLKSLSLTMTHQTELITKIKHEISETCDACIEDREMEKSIVNAMKYSEKADDLDDDATVIEEVEIMEDIQPK
ncbi:hypothetical protein [Anaerorhabdus sp.]|uniref:hypothetical protein n=1 Tax=Anaerorhabdus sp. TaxID=1872524 RepID=UPI002FC63C06